MKFVNWLIKWLLVVTTGLSAALLAIIFLSGNPVFNQFLLRLVVLLAVGFVGGLAGRVLFPKAHILLNFLTVTAANLVSILIIDLFYETPYQLVFITANFNFSEFSVSDGSQIGIMILATLLPLLFMRHREKRTSPVETKKPEHLGKPLANTMNTILHQIDPQNWQVFKTKLKTKQRKAKPASSPIAPAKPKTAAKTKVRKPAGSASTLSISRPSDKVKSVTKIKPGNGRKPSKVKPAARKLKVPAKLLGRNVNDVKLVGEEEHVCPYCLEEVIKGDKKGTVICPECGTWHHQDCWNLTGSCGVAHRNEL